MEPASPTNSTVSLTSGDTDWDFISDAEQPSTAPASLSGDYDSDLERARHHAGDDVNGSLSDEDSGDDLGRDSEDDTVHDAVRRESDRRVNEALSNSLHSTLDPFREPLPSFISGSLSSSDSTALVLSFPDPLTPSEELRAAAAARRDETASPALPPSPPLIADNTAIAHIHDDDDIKVRPPVQDTYPTSVRDQVEEAPIGKFEPTELAAEIDKDAAEEEIVIQHTNAADIQKIASYNPRKKGVNSRPRRRLSFPTSSRVFQAPNLSHSWTTSMSVGVRSISKRKLMVVLVSSVVSLLVVVLGSAIYKAGSYNIANPAVPGSMTVTPILNGPRTLNNGIVTPIVDAPKVAITTPSTTMLLQTPGAGPSTLGTAGQRGSSSTTTISDVKDEVVVKPSLALSVSRPSGATRHGSATPLSARSGLCTRGSRKGKEKEIADVHYTDAEMQTNSNRPLLLDGPRIPLALGHIIRGVKAVLNDHLPTKSEDGKSSSITDLLSLSTIVNFDELLDELILKFVSKTSSILQELSSAASVRAGSLISTASGHIAHAKVNLARQGSLVRSGAKILARHSTVPATTLDGRARFLPL
ncbi:hypothetical protein M407DRAFT_3422 [Tulasnella calospora MUT 4182]|uniref:Uncharacterized protein n=1 Tax=Tulasnella calospora MUT 4182 TaxID=1051891 RepID=A0A0C3MKM0_9AGAM|nr:hypothetical protein M407DRAFT_3422 [Tulasnella calospora MUT 4182]